MFPFPALSGLIPVALEGVLMTSKPAKKADAPDDVYSNSYVHPSNLEGFDPFWGAPSIQSPVAHIETVPVVVPADLKES